MHQQNRRAAGVRADRLLRKCDGFIHPVNQAGLFLKCGTKVLIHWARSFDTLSARLMSASGVN